MYIGTKLPKLKKCQYPNWSFREIITNIKLKNIMVFTKLAKSKANERKLCVLFILVKIHRRTEYMRYFVNIQ